MDEYFVPGVYYNITSSPEKKSIEEVSTDIAGFIGVVAKNDVDNKTPMFINKFEQFTELFGGCVPESYGDYRYLSHAVYSFFANGGKSCYIVPVYHYEAPNEVIIGNFSVATGVNLELKSECRYTKTSMKISSLCGIDITSKIQIKVTDENGRVIKSGYIGVIDYNSGSNIVYFKDTNIPAFLDNLKRDLLPSNTVVSVVGLPVGVKKAVNTLSIISKSEDIRVKSIPSRKELKAVGKSPDGFLLDRASRSMCYKGAILEVECNLRKYYYRVKEYDRDKGRIMLSRGLKVSGFYSVSICEFSLEIYKGSVLKETFEVLSMNPDTDNYFMKKCSGSAYITLAAPEGNYPYTREDPFDMPANDTFEKGDLFIRMSKEERAQDIVSAMSTDRVSVDITIEDIIGKDEGPGNRTGIHALEDIDDVSIIAVPGITNAQVHKALTEQCEKLKNRFAILDIPKGYKLKTDSDIISSYAAIYHPWVQVLNPFDNRGDFEFIPSSGAVAGIYSRSDNLYGVQKAPANEVLTDAIGVEFSYSNEDQERLLKENQNPNVNLIRAFKGRGIRIWGAYTCSKDNLWKYINVRRLIIYIKESIKKGTEWAVFEPNDLRLWESVNHSITEFLSKIWEKGYLAGETQEEAFFVKTDSSTMTQNDIDNGLLIAVIGVAPVKPAEFIVFDIIQNQTGSEG